MAKFTNRTGVSHFYDAMIHESGYFGVYNGKTLRIYDFGNNGRRVLSIPAASGRPSAEITTREKRSKATCQKESIR